MAAYWGIATPNCSQIGANPPSLFEKRGQKIIKVCLTGYTIMLTHYISQHSRVRHPWLCTYALELPPPSSSFVAFLRSSLLHSSIASPTLPPYRRESLRMALAWSYSGNGMARLSQIDLQRRYLQYVWIGYTNGDSDTTEGRSARPWPNRGFVVWVSKS